MKTLKFILHKIIIIEVMLIILYLACNLFGISIPIVSTIITYSLKYLTPVAVVALIGYIILCLLSFKIVEITIGIVLGGIILYFLFNYLLV